MVGFGADVVYKRLARGPERNLIVLAARNVEAFSPDLETTSPDRAARFFRTHLGEQIPVPEITDAPLAAVGIEELTHEVRLPALRYSDQKTGRTITIYALTYRTLDQKSRWIELSSDVLRQIQSEIDFDLHDLGSGQVLIWRHRAHIFLAVSESDSDDLRARIYFASPDSK